MKVIRFLLAAGLLVAVAASCSNSIQTAISDDSSKLEDGIYLLERTGTNAKQILPLKEGEKIIEFNQEFLDKTDQTKTYLVVNKNEFVPLTLRDKPTTQEQEDKRKRLMLKLNEEGSKALEVFTGKHINRHTSIVVNNEALTMHKVRMAIEGGNLQITRCTDNACEMLFLHLQDNVVGE